MPILLLDCIDGDVSYLGDVPQIMWRGRFWDICGNGFWNNDYGAELFCKKLGYEKGTIETIKGKSGKATTRLSFHVGECTKSDTSLLKCTPDQKVSIMLTKNCTKGHHYRVHCNGGSKGSKISCAGKYNMLFHVPFRYAI